MATEVTTTANETESRTERFSPLVSIGIIAWNEERAIGRMLEGLFQQSIFGALKRRGEKAEIVCITNGCTDRTPAIVARIFAQQTREHEFRDSFRVCLLNTQQQGKYNAWNLFVHSLSARSAQFLFLCDADIALPEPQTMWNMLSALHRHSEAHVATDTPVKDLAQVKKPGWRERLSMRTSAMTAAGPAQITGQLYCIRSNIVRRIYVPRELPSCEDGLVKALVCTDFLSHDVWPCRICVAHHASHVFEAYTTLRDVFLNQRRQVAGQTGVHLLVDKHLKTLALPQRLNPAETLRQLDDTTPDWLNKLVVAHLKRTKFFWRLYPRLISLRFERLAKLPGLQKLTALPAACAGTLMTLAAAWAARRMMAKGTLRCWPGKPSTPAVKKTAGTAPESPVFHEALRSPIT